MHLLYLGVRTLLAIELNDLVISMYYELLWRPPTIETIVDPSDAFQHVSSTSPPAV